MSGYTFRRAVREQVPLIIGLSGGTGSGKTMSAMRMAKGMSQGKPFCVIDTENGRASHYADQFTFDVLDLRAPFLPESYSQAIAAADKAGYAVIVVDSMSHVWAGDGGVLDWQEAELDRMAGNDYGKREACKMAAWIKPKLAHKAMMSTLLQVKAHLILCFRAEEKIEMVRVNGKTEVRKKESLVGKDGWVPVCEKNVPFECTCSFLLLASTPGIPHPIKLQEQHKMFFDPKQTINEFAGEQLAKWAMGGTTASEATHPPSSLKGTVEEPPLIHTLKEMGFSQADLAGKASTAPTSNGRMLDYLEKVNLSQSVRECSEVGNAAEADQELNPPHLKTVRQLVVVRMRELQKK